MKGNRIKLLREEKNIKQEKLAQILSLSPSAIGMYERDEREPNDEITLKLADFFGVSTDYLLGKTDIRNINDIKDIKFANENGINIEGLTKEQVENIKQQVEFMKWQMKQNQEEKKDETN